MIGMHIEFRGLVLPPGSPIPAMPACQQNLANLVLVKLPVRRILVAQVEGLLDSDLNSGNQSCQKHW